LKDPKEPRAKITFYLSGKNPTGTWTTVRPPESFFSSAWFRAELAAYVLRRIDTKESRAVLERLASGHKDAKPTRAAAKLLKAKDTKPEKVSFDDIWASLFSAGFDMLFELVHTPDAAKLLKAKLPAIKASQEQMTEWLKALDDEDPKVWKPAFEKLLYFRPRIALDWQEQVNAVTTARGRTALFELWKTHTTKAPAGLDADPGDTLGIVERGDRRQLKLKSPDPMGRGESVTIELKPMGEMFSFHWQRVRLAIIALERMKSDEAKAVLKQLADGHPDILPTKEAKAALERMK